MDVSKFYVPAVAVAGAITFSGAVAYTVSTEPTETLLSPTVKVGVYDKKDKSLGHGSGVHLGNGYFLTAAHVASTDVIYDYKVRYEDGTENPHKAKLIYVSAEYDFAIFRANAVDGIGQADLTDRIPERGEAVQAQGYPGDYGRLTINGEVMGAQHSNSHWPALIPLHITGSFGISGGPIFDRYGKVAGIFVSGEVPWGGTGLVVPVKVIYDLLGADFVNAIDVKE